MRRCNYRSGANPAMTFRLERLELQNFRSFSSAELDLEPNLTVLIAENGRGKSATLDALAICLSQLLGAAQSREPTERPQIAASDARSIYALPPYRNSEFPVQITAAAKIADGADTQWHGLLENPNKLATWQIPAGAKAVASARTRKRGSEVTLPVFAYYGTNRTQADVTHARSPAGGWFDRGFGYQNALKAGGSLRELGPWLALTETQRDDRTSVWDAALGSVFEAGAQVLRSHGVRRISYSAGERDLVLDFGRMSEDLKTGLVEAIDPGSSAIPMRMVADGYRSILGLVADLAFRCGVLNGHLHGEAPLLTPGVVLIDEIDMHLHPSWQTHVLNDLASAFPLVQFIVTTHSPFILSSIKGECVRQIITDGSGSTFLSPDRLTEGARIDLLSEVLLRTPARAEHGQLVRLLSGLSKALMDGESATAEDHVEQLEQLSLPLQDPDALRLIAEFKWRRQQGKI